MSIEAMKLALEALQGGYGDTKSWHKAIESAIKALRTAIQQAEAQPPATPEPVDHVGNRADMMASNPAEPVGVNQLRKELSDANDFIQSLADICVKYETLLGYRKTKAPEGASELAEARGESNVNTELDLAMPDSICDHVFVLDPKSSIRICNKCGTVERKKHTHQAPSVPTTGEPVYWEWRHLSTHPNTVDFGQWSEWQRVEARNPIFTAEDALAEFRTYIAQGYKYELRALYTTPQPAQAALAASAEDMRVYDSIADRYFREATQAEVTDGFVLVNRGTIESAMQHVPYRGEVWQELNAAILAQRPERVPMTDEQVDSFRVDGRLHWLGKRQIIRAVEAHYSIPTKAKGDQ